MKDCKDIQDALDRLQYATLKIPKLYDMVYEYSTDIRDLLSSVEAFLQDVEIERQCKADMHREHMADFEEKNINYA